MLSIIVAFTDKERVIGKDGGIPWDLPEDREFFKDTTDGHFIIMGRKTFESLPKILPNRYHIVLTRDRDYSIGSDYVDIEHNMDKLFKKLKYDDHENFVIGGEEIYKYAIKYANNIYATVLYENIDGDAHFPEIVEKFWDVESYSDIKVSKTGIVYSMIKYKRRKKK